jgi:hypothetical protein
MIDDIRHSVWPLCPASQIQDQWLNDRVWDMILTCWSEKPEQRCELAVMHYIFSMPNLPDALVEFPPVGHKNLILLAEELLYTFLALPLDPPQRTTLRMVQGYISNIISRDGASRTTSSAKVAEFTKMCLKVSLPCSISCQALKPMVVRQHQSYHPLYDLPHFACGSDFIPMPSSLTCKSSQI